MASPAVRKIVVWAARVLAWDGILPALTIGIVVLVNIAFKRYPDVGGVTAVALVIANFFIRILSGLAHISDNGCGTSMRWIQGILLIIGIIYLMGLEAFFLALVGVDDRLFAGAPLEVLVLVYLPYLIAMSIVLYPGDLRREEDEKAKLLNEQYISVKPLQGPGEY